MKYGARIRRELFYSIVLPHPDQESCLLVGVQDILLIKMHKVANRVLQVSVYHKCLGLIPPHHDTTKPSGWIPKNVTVPALCPLVWNFLLTSATSRELVDSEMAGVSAVVDWESFNDSANSVELTCSLSHQIEGAHNMAKSWHRTAVEALLDVLAKNFASEQLETLQEAWQPFLDRVGYIDQIDPETICVDFSNEACSVSIAGLQAEVGDLSSRFEEDRAKVEDEMTRARSIVTEMKSGLRWHQLIMLKAIGFIPQQQKRFADLTIALDMSSLTVQFTGMPADIMSAKLEMHEILSGMTETSVETSALLISLLHGKRLMMHLVGQFKRVNIRAICTCVGKTKLTVYALSDEHLTTAIEVINAAITETSIDADADKMLAPQKWTRLLKSLQSKHDGLLSIDRSQNAVVLTGENSRVAVALEEMQRFLGENIVDDQFIAMEHGVAAYLHAFKTEDIAEIVQAFPNGTVKVTAKLDEPYGYVASGNVDGLEGTVQKVNKLVNNVVSQQFTVDKPGVVQFVASAAGSHSFKRLEQKHKVIIEPVIMGKYPEEGEGEVLVSADGAGSDGSGSIAAAGAGPAGSGSIAAAPDNGSMAALVSLPGGVTVEVVRGDLTKFHADAIVNFANEQLEHIEGLAKAIVDAGNTCVLAVFYVR